jgi:hypothetical protein
MRQRLSPSASSSQQTSKFRRTRIPLEHVTVISGTFNIGMGDKLDTTKTRAIPAGGVAIMQPKMNHFAWTKEETILQVHGVGPWAVNYVNPADDPRKKTQ